ncbi:DNA mismatch repair protein MutS [Alphaproteobacteria bacterium]|nr:DNA mismatch repair protein MutS [Alphaproteobacteria bacterium]
MKSSQTPMVRQYLSLKEKHKECLLLFRLGDFYELFCEDARLASSALDITLTKRGKDEDSMPMCGIPFHAAENYIGRLIKKGFKVAICEQMETPEEAKKRGPKSIVHRDVMRIITPGTLVEETFLDSDQNNFLIALHHIKGAIGVAAIDISTGDFFTENVLISSLESAISRLNPKEILVSDQVLKLTELYEFFQSYKDKITPQSSSRFEVENSQTRLCHFFSTATLDVFGSFSEVEVSAAGGALEYISLTQKENLPRLNPPKKIDGHSFLQIDAATRRSLELDYTLSGSRKGSFFSTIDKTCTAGGKRLISHTLSFPLLSIDGLNERLDQVSWLLKDKKNLESLRKSLKEVPDGERILARLSLNRGGPRDLLAIKTLLDVSQDLFSVFNLKSSPLKLPTSALFSLKSLKDKLEKALDASPPLLAREGGFIASGYLKELDDFRFFRDESQKMVASLQAKYVAETKIPNLKIKHNNVLGYYIEITLLHKEKVPDTFIHRQTLVNNMRFSTPELVEIQEKLMGASDKALALEVGLFQTLVQDVLHQQEPLCQIIQFLSNLDLISSFAFLSDIYKYVRPTLDSEPLLTITKGRHPTIECMMKSQNHPFVSNDCLIDHSQKLLLLTGPNMAGKSTYLRQNALIIILAQMGCYVPAEKAHIGIVDRLFSRVGAGDDLTKGRSTFMMEMIETASILNQATEKSFVILDEIGRGTSTYDGVSIAQATAEHLHNKNKCRTLFATHYHEITALEKSLKHLKCYTISVKEWEGSIVFLHAIVPGKADRSYGLHVAALAGVPKSVIRRAEIILKDLESGPSDQKESLPLFQQKKEGPAALTLLKETNPNTLSPREALDLVYKLKEKIEEPHLV